MPPHFDISDSFDWVEDLPYPRWELIDAWVQSQVTADEHGEVWTDIARQWLLRLGDSLGPHYELDSSPHCLLLNPFSDSTPELLLRLLEASHQALLSILDGVADFQSPGKLAAIVLPDSEEYYWYVSPFHSEGHHGGSAGMHVRNGYPHVVARGRQLFNLQCTLAHEMTHAALTHLPLPLWLEEGLTQMFEEDMTGRQPILVDSQLAGRHKKYWTKHGLDAFWHGTGFAQPGKVQELCYQLSEILLRLLAAEYRPRWFGLDRGPQGRLLSFLSEANFNDCGESAAREHLQRSLADLASWFLGPGNWSPSLFDPSSTST